MAATTLTAVPKVIFAGDTLLFSVGFDGYEASQGWVATWDFRAKDGTAISFSGTADGDKQLVSVAPATTAAWVPTGYQGIARVTKTGQTFTVWRGSLSIEPDLTQQTGSYDTRSHAKKCLDAIEAVLEGKATRDVLNTTIAGQSVGRLTPEQLIAFRSYYLAEVAAEEMANNGDYGTKNVLAIFNTP